MLEFVMVLLASHTVANTDAPRPRLDRQVFLTEEGCQHAVDRTTLPTGFHAVCVPTQPNLANAMVAAF
jgi:hypothetical protein